MNSWDGLMSGSFGMGLLIKRNKLSFYSGIPQKKPFILFNDDVTKLLFN